MITVVSSGQNALKALRNAGVFRVEDAIREGLSRATLGRLVARGEVQRVGRGLYLHSKAKVDPREQDFATACAKFGPQSCVGALTALFHYDLIEQVPNTIWVMVPYGRKTTERIYRCLRTKLPPDVGVIDRGSYRISSLERSIVEAFRYETKIGLRTAVHAAKQALSRRLTTEAKILRMAKALGVEKWVGKYWEALIA
jgi:predicted transcriptional regulator of viral defense system